VEDVPADDPAGLSLTELLPLLERRELAARELVLGCLARVASAEAQVQAFVALTPDLALAAAGRADQARARGERVGRLAGVPVALKDLYLTRGTPTTASSRVLAGYDPGVDAAVWERLSAAGAGLLGKTTTHEFAYGTDSRPTRNPWDLTRTPGGSSGGSAAALAARMVPVATGSDTGGSLRIPAAACGISALRAAHGRVSAYGVLPLGPSLDVVGPMARRLLDVALLLRLLAGYDARDPYSRNEVVPLYPLAPPRDLTGVRVGLPLDLQWAGVDAQLAGVCHEALQLLVDRGATLVEIAAPMRAAEVMAAYDTVNGAEALHVHRELLASRELYTPQVLGRLLEGEGISAAAYLEAGRLRLQWRQQWRAVLDAHQLDAVAHPTIDRPPQVVDPEQPARGPSIRLSLPWSLTGFPALSVPAGLDGRGLPVGVTLAGLPEREADLVGLGVVIDEQIALWQQEPPSPE
jgi:aspartyl-tRNA(Asn)/glutamyl-tRNA(Gln) amidotransferase subunit A